MRLVRCYPKSTLVETRPVVRVRVRRCVIRVRISETAVSVRVVVRTTDNTAVGLFRAAKVSNFIKISAFHIIKVHLRRTFWAANERGSSLSALPLTLFSKFSLDALTLYSSTSTMSPLKARRDPQYALETEDALFVFV